VQPNQNQTETETETDQPKERDMKTLDRNGNMRRQQGIAAAVLGSIILFAVTDGHTAGKHSVEPPARSEFGAGPRTSVGGHYAATLRLPEPLRPRKMQTISVVIEDSAGRPVEEAAITVDGGMPKHGHGLPTKPRVTKKLGGGAYEIEGVRYNMGGWWEFKLTIEGPAGTDSVTFNLDL
jgi:hypothetical protein